MKFLSAVAEFVADPVNILIFLFLWVGIALFSTAESTMEVKVVFLTLMALPAVLGYAIGRSRK
jgi:hypothetical protein